MPAFFFFLVCFQLLAVRAAAQGKCEEVIATNRWGPFSFTDRGDYDTNSCKQAGFLSFTELEMNELRCDEIIERYEKKSDHVDSTFAKGYVKIEMEDGGGSHFYYCRRGEERYRVSLQDSNGKTILWHDIEATGTPDIQKSCRGFYPFRTCTEKRDGNCQAWHPDVYRISIKKMFCVDEGSNAGGLALTSAETSSPSCVSWAIKAGDVAALRKDGNFCVDTPSGIVCDDSSVNLWTYHGDCTASRSPGWSSYNADHPVSFPWDYDLVEANCKGKPLGSTLAIKLNGKWCANEPDGTFNCNRDQVLEWEVWTLGGFCSVEGAFGSVFNVLDYNFELHWIVNGCGGKPLGSTLAIKSDGMWCANEPDGTINCNRDQVLEWEVWTLGGFCSVEGAFGSVFNVLDYPNWELHWDVNEEDSSGLSGGSAGGVMPAPTPLRIPAPTPGGSGGSGSIDNGNVGEVDHGDSASGDSGGGDSVNGDSTSGEGSDNATGNNSGVGGDPHINTWSHEDFDFQGQCDLVFVDNPTFMDGTGMHIHGRTVLHGTWSAISSAAIMIGDDVLEVHGEDAPLINGLEVSIPKMEDGSEYAFATTIGGYSLTVQYRGPHSRKFITHLGHGERIFINNFKEFVDVDVEGPRSAEFAGSNGLMGSWSKGTKVGRDLETVIKDANEFGQEWQVCPTDPQLFSVMDGPQYPDKCKMPEELTANQRHLRAMSKKVSEDSAKEACSKASPRKMQKCIADVFGSDNLDLAGIYIYN